MVVALLHLPLVIVPLASVSLDRDGPAFIVIDGPPPRAITLPDPYVAPRWGAPGTAPRPAPSGLGPVRPPADRERPRAVETPGPAGPPVDSGGAVPSPIAPTPAPPANTTGRPGDAPRIAPSYASGRLWVRPLPVSPQRLAEQLRERTHIEQVDSAVTAVIQQYLDRLAEEEGNAPVALPSWTTKIGGQTVGIDSKWVYLGPIRVPAFLLALIPLNTQANPTQAEMNRRLSVMREDLMEAARRAANYADFKDAVDRLRAEKQRERDLQRAQRTAPADTGSRR